MSRDYRIHESSFGFVSATPERNLHAPRQYSANTKPEFRRIEPEPPGPRPDDAGVFSVVWASKQRRAILHHASRGMSEASLLRIYGAIAVDLALNSR